MKGQRKLDDKRVVIKTASDVVAALRSLYPAREYALIEQVANSTGFSARRWSDAIVMNLWPSRGLTLLGVEIKVARYDWLSELSQPEKADTIAKYCDGWVLAVGDAAIVQNGELPDGWGLAVPESATKMRIEISPRLKPAEERTPLDRGFLGAILRRAQEQITPEAKLNDAYAKGHAEGVKSQQEAIDFLRAEEKKERNKVRIFQEYSGVYFDYKEPDEIRALAKIIAHANKSTIGEITEALHRETVDGIKLTVDSEIEKLTGKEEAA